MSSSSTLHSLQVTRTARVATLGAPSSAAVWWIVLHGYGQLAADFIDHFNSVVAPERCIVAPEALSRFYVDGLENHEEVGASWMTREDRAHEIGDYVSYLDATVQHLRPNRQDPTVRVLGFSQGAATASRWALLGETVIDRLVLWSGGLAHDLDLSAHAASLQTMNLTVVGGTEDPHVTAERGEQVRHMLDRHDIPVTVHTFDGGHRLDDDTLDTVVEEPS